ncbi:hypothetical protein B6U93_00605 [Candidatus Woesearchaeota archaeon ex4484_78]|nr:MAG: hypothetical protein B6U93_00605 [Candidatus Woesearchaeota archaeon ex4484_78]
MICKIKTLAFARQKPLKMVKIFNKKKGEVTSLKKKVVKAHKKPKTVKKSKTKKEKPKIKVVIERKILGQAPERHEFILSDGRRLKNIYQLVDELETMTEDVFRQYVNEFKNDFANWIEDVFEDKSLADELRQIEDRLETQRAILKELVRQLTLAQKKKK